MLCLHLLQIALLYINTLMIQRVLGEVEWQNRLMPSDLRGLTPLLFTHICPYGTFRLDMSTRLSIEPPRLGPSSVHQQLSLDEEHALAS
jgi:Tn3 transposase DDE domain